MIRRNTWIVLGVLVVLLAVAYYLPQTKGAEDAEDVEGAVPTSPASQALLEARFDRMVGLEIEDNTGQRVNLTLVEGAWILAEPEVEEIQMDLGQINSAVNQVASLQVVTTLESDLVPALIGLEEPAYTITLTFDDDQEIFIYVGSETTTSSGYYVQVAGEPAKVVSKFSIEPLLALVSDPPVLPTPTAEIEATTQP
jgi:hypothetical protein